MKICLATFLVCSVVATNAAAQEPAPIDVWGPYFNPMLLVDVAGKKGTAIVELRRAFILHRKDFEKISVIGVDLKSCGRDLGDCEQREVDRAVSPSFWDSGVGRVLFVVGGFAAGVGVTVGILYATGAAR